MHTIKTTVVHKVTICLIIVVNINCAVSQYNVPYYYEVSFRGFFKTFPYENVE